MERGNVAVPSIDVLLLGSTNSIVRGAFTSSEANNAGEHATPSILADRALAESTVDERSPTKRTALPPTRAPRS